MTTKAQRRENQERMQKFMEGEYHYIAHDLGAEMIEHNNYHFKFIKNGIAVDIWPGPKKYWCEKKRKKGVYQDLEKTLQALFN